MDNEIGEKELKPFFRRPVFLITAVIIILLALLIGGYFVYAKFFVDETKKNVTTTDSTTAISSGAPVSIPATTIANKFGFLSAGVGDSDFIKSVGAVWVRPHPGAFVWERIQSSAEAQYSFSISDKEAERYQKDGVAMIATIWPFADWDQVRKSDQANCLVSSNDEFAPGGEDEKKGAKAGLDEETYGRGYLPLHRCAPYDFTAYKKWVSAIVERYDGDGTDDMPGLTMPIKYWEVMNEPDLGMENPVPGVIDRLDFWKDTPAAYGTLLINTNEAIKAADSEAKTVIAGAAGGSKFMLDFYRSVFADAAVIQNFDIGNIHCITNGDVDSFNLAPYKLMLAEFNIDKPVWITEAQALISNDPDINATQVYNSTKKALELGAARIFYTQYDFNQLQGMNSPRYDGVVPKATISGQDAETGYKIIIGQ